MMYKQCIIVTRKVSRVYSTYCQILTSENSERSVFLKITNIDANDGKQGWLVLTQFLFFRIADPCLMVKTTIYHKNLRPDRHYGKRHILIDPTQPSTSRNRKPPQELTRNFVLFAKQRQMNLCSANYAFPMKLISIGNNNNNNVYLKSNVQTSSIDCTY